MATRAKPPRPGKGKTPRGAEARSLKRGREKDAITRLRETVEEFDPTDAEKFKDLPLSPPTAAGLAASKFQDLTDIQRRAIPLALKGRDILGAAKTGSGKTLAFLVPLLEKLYREQWTEYDGLGALVISPTRELAVQIFEVLRKIGRKHTFSAGLVIGGKSLKEEAMRLARMNILVCTPGRMLQHLDQTAGIEVDNLQMLVLDEADRIMDMGFQSAVDALVEHLPKGRQTLLFSATQSKKVSDLARLSLQEPEYVSVHEAAASATPNKLQQHYMVTPLSEKLDTLYSFIKSNLKCKMIVFFSSGKQVRFVYESFRRLQPGIPLLHLHGRQKQVARLEITRRFMNAKFTCLFATDVVARGVDFPAVDWVVQVDCPEDADTYIHRVGRTARYENNGQAILFLDPSEEQGFLKRLEHKKVPVQKVNVKESKKRSIMDDLQHLGFKNADVKYLGQKAFISYVRSIHYNKDKEVFKLEELDLDGFAASLGLPGAPQIKFQKGDDVKKLKNAPRTLQADNSSESESGSGSGSDSDAVNSKKRKRKSEVRTKYDRMFERQNQDVLSSHYTNLIGNANEDDEQDFLAVKRVLGEEELADEASKGTYEALPKVFAGTGKDPIVIDSKRKEKALLSKKKMLKYKDKGTKLVFDDEGTAHATYEMQTEEDFAQAGPAEEQRQKFVEGETTRVKEADVDDKALAKQKRREKKDKRKAREREEAAAAAGGPTLAGGEDAEKEREAALELLRSLPTQGSRSNDDEEESEEEERPAKKAKKWFQNDEDEQLQRKKGKGKDKSGRKVIEVDHEPETLEDFEALAMDLLED